MWRGDRTFFFWVEGLNLEQVLAYRKCGEGIALFFFFLRSEPGTGAGRVDRNCGEREIGIADFSQLMGMRVSLAFFLHFFTSFSHVSLFFSLFPLFPSFFSLFLFFCTFSHLFHLFHIISLVFSPFFPLSFFAFFFALSLTWPRPQPCRLTLPSLALPHITSPLLSFLNTFFFFF